MTEMQDAVLKLLKEAKADADFTDFDCDVSLSKYNFDSLDMMNVYFLLEERLGVEIELDAEESTGKIFSLNELIAHIKQ